MIAWGIIIIKMKISHAEASSPEIYTDRYLNKINISANIQKDADVISTWLRLMMSMYCEFKIIDATYTPVNKARTAIPILGDDAGNAVDTDDVMDGDNNSAIMHTKYNTMHES
jgi:hypothetical protein